MPANKRGHCGACCTRLHSCEGCFGAAGACAPRYLCAHAEIEWGPYTDLDSVCCGLTPYSVGVLDWRLPSDCSTWSASGTCTGLETPLDITVTVERVDADNCRTKVDSTLMEEPAYFPGVFPADMIVELATPEGDVATVTIEQAEMITLPLATLKCSPCGCATGCYPKRLCTTVTLSATAYEEAVTEAGIIEWDCDHDHWTGTVAEQLIVISGKPVEDQICGLNVVVTGDRAALTGEILLDNGWHPRRFHGAPCRDSDGITMTHGVPELLPCPPEEPECEDPPDEEYISTIDHSFDLLDGDSVVGSLTVRDLSCGEVCEACEGPPIQANCCEFTPIPRTIHGTWNYGGCTPGCDTVVTAFRYNDAESVPDVLIWDSTVSICGMNFRARLICGTSFGMSEWNLVADNDSHILCPGPSPVGGPYGAIRTGSSCDPLLINMLWSWTGNCCPDGSVGMVMTCDITL